MCRFCNKSSGLLKCIKTNRVVSTREWCSAFDYPFSKETRKTERLDPVRYGFSYSSKDKPLQRIP